VTHLQYQPQFLVVADEDDVMTQNTARTPPAFLRLSLNAGLVALSMFVGAIPALAGDRAQANYLGFSDDGRYFAYEQYGILDGSGGFYSDVFVIDLTVDKWLDGVPFSAEADGEDETQSLAATRATAMWTAQPLLDRYGISNPVAIAVLNGDGALDGNSQPLDGRTVHFGQPFYAGIQYDYTLTLAPFGVANSATCIESADFPYQGFALTLTDTISKATREPHRDPAEQPLPAARGCALGYSIYSIVYPLESEGDPVALISIYTQGFEGLDRRFIAVPVGRL
jgi:predicted secreted protein